MIKSHNSGFTLIELLVVVLIIGILAAMALPQYFKAVERSRMGEAVTLMANIAQAQQRKYLQINKYTGDFRGLDVAPKGATGATFFTKGDPVDSDKAGNGFQIDLSTGDETLKDFKSGKVTATRFAPAGGTLQYAYTLQRYYAGTGTACSGTDETGNGAALCADFCGIDTMTTNKWCCSDGSTDPNGVDEEDLTGACTPPDNNDIPTGD